MSRDLASAEFSRRTGSAPQRAKTSQKFGQIEWFDQVIVRAGIETTDTVSGSISRGEHQDGSSLLFSHPLEHFPAIEARKDEIERDGGNPRCLVKLGNRHLQQIEGADRCRQIVAGAYFTSGTYRTLLHQMLS